MVGVAPQGAGPVVGVAQQGRVVVGCVDSLMEVEEEVWMILQKDGPHANNDACMLYACCMHMLYEHVASMLYACCMHVACMLYGRSNMFHTSFGRTWRQRNLQGQ